MRALRFARVIPALLALISVAAAAPFGDRVHPPAPQRIPGAVFCAYYDAGGEGVAYHDTEAENQGSGKLNPVDGSYLNEFRRAEGIDISYTKQLNDLASPCNQVVPPLGLLYVGWNEPGEWFRLTVETASAGAYVADVLYTSQRGGTIGVDVDGRTAGEPFALTSTFDPAETIPWRQWHHWNIARDAFTMNLPKGVSVLTIRIVSGGNLNLATFAFRTQGAPRTIDLLAEKNALPMSWRPFSGDSPWNQPIAANAPTDSDSRAMIDDFASRGALFVNIKDWSVPVYFVDADHTPLHDVGDSRPGIYGRGFDFPRRIPIPADAVASPPYQADSDNHLCIVDRAKGLEWGMWLAQKDASGRWFTSLGAVTDLAGAGVAPPWFESAREFDSHRARASGFPLIAGLMLLEEFRAGRINHALVFAYDHCRTEFFVPPASTAQVTLPTTTNARGIPMGGRIQLDPAWDVEHSKLSHSGKIIARALQEYGAYCGDYAGANVVYVENSPAAVAAWEGILNYRELEATFTPDFIRERFRVIDSGNLLPGQNLKIPPPFVVQFSRAGEKTPARIDQLSRTIRLRAPRDRARATWEIFPRGSALLVDGRTLEGSSAEIDFSRVSVLTARAPDGATSEWHIVTDAF